MNRLIRDRHAFAVKVAATRKVFANWPIVGAASMARRLSDRLPSPIAQAARRLQFKARPRAGRPISARLIDLGALYGVYVDREYDLAGLDWTSIDTVIDCGANIGGFSLWALDRGARRVFSVEPGRDTYAVLSRNARAAEGLINTAMVAVGGARGQATFHEAGYSGNSSLIRTDVVSRARTAISYEVEVVTIADLLQMSGFDRCSVLKLDIEGAEAGVFANLGPDTLDRCDSVLLEVHEYLGVDRGRIVDSLLGAGFVIRDQVAGGTSHLLATRR